VACDDHEATTATTLTHTHANALLHMYMGYSCTESCLMSVSTHASVRRTPPEEVERNT